MFHFTSCYVYLTIWTNFRLYLNNWFVAYCFKRRFGHIVLPNRNIWLIFYRFFRLNFFRTWYFYNWRHNVRWRCAFNRTSLILFIIHITVWVFTSIFTTILFYWWRYFILAYWNTTLDWMNKGAFFVGFVVVWVF